MANSRTHAIASPRAEINTKQQVYDALIAEIGAGNWLPHDKFLSERALAQTYQCARSTAREVLALLASQGFITRAAGKVSRVKNLLVSEPHSKAGASVGLVTNVDWLAQNSRALVELLEARMLLESQAAYYAATRATPSDLEKLSIAYEQMVSLPLSSEALTRAKADLTFHSTIANISHNLFVISFSDTFYTRYYKVIYEVLSQYLGRLGRYPDGITAQHHDIYHAIIKQKPEEAEQLTRAHIAHTIELFKTL